MPTYKIPTQNFPKFTKKITSLIKKSAKLDCTPITFEPLYKLTIVRQRVDSTTRMLVDDSRTYQVVEVEGGAPKIEGAEFIARLQHFRLDDGTLLNTLYVSPGVKDEDVPEEFRTRACQCDHCGTKRYRKDTFLVKDSEGVKQVGSTCLADFLGLQNPERIAESACFASVVQDALSELEDSDWGRGGMDPVFDLEDLLRLVSVVINDKGWLSASAASAQYDRDPDGYYPSTSTHVGHCLFPGMQEPREMIEWRRDMLAQKEALEGHFAQEVLEAIKWARDDLGASTSNYFWNLHVIASRGNVTCKEVGLVCSLLPSFRRATAAQDSGSKEAARPSSYVGEIKKRQEMEVLVKSHKECFGQFGVTVLHIMEDRDGNQIRWFSSNGVLPHMEWVKVKATPVRHEEYKGVKQTQVNRVSRV